MQKRMERADPCLRHRVRGQHFPQPYFQVGAPLLELLRRHTPVPPRKWCMGESVASEAQAVREIAEVVEPAHHSPALAAGLVGDDVDGVVHHTLAAALVSTALDTGHGQLHGSNCEAAAVHGLVHAVGVGRMAQACPPRHVEQRIRRLAQGLGNRGFAFPRAPRRCRRPRQMLRRGAALGGGRLRQSAAIAKLLRGPPAGKTRVADVIVAMVVAAPAWARRRDDLVAHLAQVLPLQDLVEPQALLPLRDRVAEGASELHLSRRHVTPHVAGCAACFAKRGVVAVGRRRGGVSTAGRRRGQRVLRLRRLVPVDHIPQPHDGRLDPERLLEGGAQSRVRFARRLPSNALQQRLQCGGHLRPAPWVPLDKSQEEAQDLALLRQAVQRLAIAVPPGPCYRPAEGGEGIGGVVRGGGRSRRAAPLQQGDEAPVRVRQLVARVSGGAAAAAGSPGHGPGGVDGPAHVTVADAGRQGASPLRGCPPHGRVAVGDFLSPSCRRVRLSVRLFGRRRRKRFRRRHAAFAGCGDTMQLLRQTPQQSGLAAEVGPPTPRAQQLLEGDLDLPPPRRALQVEVHEEPDRRLLGLQRLQQVGECIRGGTRRSMHQAPEGVEGAARIGEFRRRAPQLPCHVLQLPANGLHVGIAQQPRLLRHARRPRRRAFLPRCGFRGASRRRSQRLRGRGTCAARDADAAGDDRPQLRWHAGDEPGVGLERHAPGRHEHKGREDRGGLVPVAPLRGMEGHEEGEHIALPLELGRGHDETIRTRALYEVAEAFEGFDGRRLAGVGAADVSRQTRDVGDPLGQGQ
mmetsp:Transcript_61391/g.176727  ORF Transcript_61391/g.176727 Transcript_61391/m.176727 type:complete len:799 (+) Transcript_61391:164-2560(+)